MQRTSAKKHAFTCGYTRINETAPCYRLTILESELEAMIYAILLKQAQVIVNLEDLSDASAFAVQAAEREEFDKKIATLQDKKAGTL